MTDVLDALVDERWIMAHLGIDRATFHELFRADELDRDVEPNSLFDSVWYRAHHGLGANVPALRHYLEKGWKLGFHPGPFFDTDEYLRNRPPLDAEPLGHFLNAGRLEGRVPFRPSEEVIRRLIVDERGAPALEAMRRWCADHEMLDDEWYAWHNDLADPCQSESHYWATGHLNDARPNLYFDPAWYRETYAEVKESGLVSYVHFVLHGWPAGKNPSRFLNARRFREHVGSGLPFAAISSGAVPAGVVAPAYPGGTPGLSADIDMPRRLERRPLVGPTTSLDNHALRIHWVIPDPGHGGGGHANIFKLAGELQRNGHPQQIWVDEPTLHTTEASLRHDVLRWYDYYGDIGFLPDSDAPELEGDVVVATSWQSAQRVLHLDRFRRRVYLVQDYEPAFYPAGSLALQARATYTGDFDFFCASPWLADKLAAEFDAWTTHFLLIPDASVYRRYETWRSNHPPRIVAYAREHTTRRCVELLQSALTELACRGVAFELYAFGISEQSAAAWRNIGVPIQAVERATPAELAEQYRGADLGIALSSTNYSQVPPEMMACGLPVIDLRLEATSRTYPDGVVDLAAPDALSLADTIENLLADDHRRYRQAQNAYEWVHDLSWSEVAERFISTAQERIQANPIRAARKTAQRTLVTVAIPSLNARHHLSTLMDALAGQRCEWEYEVLVVDSESEDDSAEFAAELGARVIEIKRSDFQHGRTRNLAVSRAKGEFVAFLTQDAIPADDRWLHELVSPMLGDSTIAGSFGRHRAHHGASAFAEIELREHFDGLASHPPVLSRDTDRARYEACDPGWRQLLYFFSDNNSCLRKQLWKQFPYPAIPFGEDQAWARTIVDAGYSKAYVDRAVVRHSHDYAPDEAKVRGWEEAWFFAEHFGLLQIPTLASLERVISARRDVMMRLARQHSIPQAELERQLAVERAKYEGALYGSSLRPLPAVDRGSSSRAT